MTSDDERNHRPRSILNDVKRLLELEERQLDEELTEAERRRWEELSHELLGVSGDVAERRRSLRVHVVRDATVSGDKKDEAARVLSVSAGGLFVATTSAPPVGEKMDVTVSLPQRHPEDINFRVQVRWRAEGDEGEATGRTGVGASFIRLGSRQRQAVLDLVKDRLYHIAYTRLERYQHFVEELPEVVLWIDSEGRIAEANMLARARLDRGEGRQLVGTQLEELLTASSGELLVESLRTAAQSGCVVRCEAELRAREEGEPVSLDVLISPALGADFGLVLLGRESTEVESIEADDQG